MKKILLLSFALLLIGCEKANNSEVLDALESMKTEIQILKDQNEGLLNKNKEIEKENRELKENEVVDISHILNEKERCSKYLPDIEKRAIESTIMLSYDFLRKPRVYYSPFLESCVATMIVASENGNNTGWILDLLTGDNYSFGIAYANLDTYEIYKEDTNPIEVLPGIKKQVFHYLEELYKHKENVDKSLQKKR